MKLCMFSPRDRDLPRGWPGRIDGDRVVQLAAQTLQAFFTGGGEAREHAGTRSTMSCFARPFCIRRPMRIFGQDGDFSFANSAAIYGPDDAIPLPDGVEEIEPVPGSPR